MKLAPLLLLLVLVLPIASADHVFSHRAIVTGRVIGSDGVPVAGAPVTLTFDGITDGGRCFDSKVEETGPRGDFTLCRHVHAMPSTPVNVTLVIQNTTRTVPFDTELRRTAVAIVLDEPAATRDIGGMRLFERTVSVAGRTFIMGDQEVEGVAVNGTTRPGIPLSVRIIDITGAILASGNGSADIYGDYFIDLGAANVPDGAIVEVASGDERAAGIFDEQTRRVDIDLVKRPAPREPIVGRPGTSEIPALGVVAILASILVAVRVTRRV